MPGVDNSHLKEKVELRARHCPPGNVIVLDAFGGHGIVWREVMTATGRTNIQRVGIDKKKKNGLIKGDNLKWLKGFSSLEQFAVIDLDGYGIPFRQVEILFERKYQGVIFVTFIQSVMGILPLRFLSSCGLSPEMVRAVPSLYGQRGWRYWLEYLAANGVRTVFSCDIHRKHYHVFSLK